MYWIFLLLALGALAVAFSTSSMAVLLLFLLISVLLFVAWAMGLYSAKVSSQRDDGAQIIDPVELHRLRELAAARKAGDTAAESRDPPQP
ncbi:hypothetical protein CSC70_01995 [Pseudoxanthomonas kalamensis DSM 18571]|nr:hypothetical protein CSC70_01995 [Pseudoxanthomonas kalamensis DSM 18571]